MHQQFSDIPAVVVLIGLETKRSPLCLRLRQERVKTPIKSVSFSSSLLVSIIYMSKLVYDGEKTPQKYILNLSGKKTNNF